MHSLTVTINLILENYKNGKLHIPEHLVSNFESDFNSLIWKENEIIPDSISPRLKALINMYVFDIINTKSLHDIQLEYLEIFNKYWLNLHSLVSTNNYDLVKFSHVYTKDMLNSSNSQKFIKHICDFISEITDFWSDNWQNCFTKIKDSSDSKASYGGSLFPSPNEDIVSTAGLYLDTLILPCPVMKNKPFFDINRPQEVIQNFIENILYLMHLSNLIKEDLEKPIIIIFPSEDNLRKLEDKGTDLSLKTSGFIHKHFSSIFYENFSNIKEVSVFLNSLDNIDMIECSIKNSERFAFPKNNLSLKENLNLFINEFPNNTLPVGEIIFRRLWSQIGQGYYINENSMQINSTPLVTYESSWNQLKWSLEYQAMELEANKNLASHISKSLFSEKHFNLDWFGTVPVETILEIRKNKHEEEIRHILSNGVMDLINLQPDNYFRTSDKVISNLENAFQEHSEKLKSNLHAKIKLYGFTTPFALSSLGLGIASSMIPSLGSLGQAIGVGLSIAGFTEKVPGVTTIRKEYKDIKNSENYNKTAVALLFKHLK